MNKDPSRRFYKNPLMMSVVTMDSFVLLLLLIFSLGSPLYSIEEKLKYAPPPIHGASGGDSFAIDLTDHQTGYVPVCSHIYAGEGEAELLSTLLSIRNSDPERAITVTSLCYYGTKGDLVQEHVEGSLRLGPLETTGYLVEKPDTRGGSGAGFTLAWRADEPGYEPIVDAVMVGGSAGNISFNSLGRPLAERVG